MADDPQSPPPNYRTALSQGSCPGCWRSALSERGADGRSALSPRGADGVGGLCNCICEPPFEEARETCLKMIEGELEGALEALDEFVCYLLDSVAPDPFSGLGEKDDSDMWGHLALTVFEVLKDVLEGLTPAHLGPHCKLHLLNQLRAIFPPGAPQPLWLVVRLSSIYSWFLEKPIPIPETDMGVD